MATKQQKKTKKIALSAGVIPVIFIGEEALYLLLRVYNYWDFPKGIVESGEQAINAAIRELKEETGIEKIEFHWGKTFRETEPYSYGKIARYYIAQAASKEVILLPNPTTKFVEHHEYRWVTFTEAQELVGFRVGEVLTWADTFIRQALKKAS